MPTSEHDVVGLDVAVNDAFLMGVGQCVEQFRDDTDGLLDGQLTLASQPVAQRLALDVRHDVVDPAVGLTAVVQWEDGRVLEPCGDFDLTEKAVGTEPRGKLGTEDLDGDPAVVLQILGQVYGAHAALAERALEAVAVPQGFDEAGGDLGHAARGGQALNMDQRVSVGKSAARACPPWPLLVTSFVSLGMR